MVDVTVIQSLAIVRDELEATLGQIESYLETFIADRTTPEHIEKCLEPLDQVRGVFKLIDLPGCEMLAQELLESCKTVDVARDGDAEGRKANDACLAALSSGVFVLLRYIDFVGKYQRLIPTLLVPAINDVRKARGSAGISESHFYTINTDISSPAAGPLVPAGKLGPAAKRLRQMYQVGLLGILRGQDPAMSLQMMSRAVERVDRFTRGHPVSRLWWVAAAGLESMQREKMEVTPLRRNLVTMLERFLKNLVYKTDEALQEAPRDALVREFIYLCALAEDPGPKAQEVLTAVGGIDLGFNERTLAEERKRLSGPGGAVLRTMAGAVKEKIGKVKQSIDQTARDGNDTEHGVLIEQLEEIRESLGMLQLEKAQQLLAGQVETIRGWQESGQPPGNEDLSRVAEVLLYLDSAVTALENEDGGLAQSVLDDADALIAPSQLDDATAAVVKEIQSGLGQAKHALMDFMGGDWDAAHLESVPGALDGVHGGLMVLGKMRGSQVAVASRKYIAEQLIEARVQPDQAALDALADALASLEYYVDGLGNRKGMGETILDVAEDSLRELGYATQ